MSASVLFSHLKSRLNTYYSIHNILHASSLLLQLYYYLHMRIRKYYKYHTKGWLKIKFSFHISAIGMLIYLYSYVWCIYTHTPLTLTLSADLYNTFIVKYIFRHADFVSISWNISHPCYDYIRL